MRPAARPRAWLLLLPALLAACANAGVPELQLSQPLVLLGEVHDNAAQHALRLQAYQRLLDSGARPALVMEQLDRDRQGAIDALRASKPDADALIAAVGGPGWRWAYYRPFIDLALRRDLPIVAAGISRDDARRIMRDGLAAAGFDAAVADDIIAAQTRSIQSSHCDALDAATAARMALAQVARDQAMARALAASADRGAVLLAGNGHVRTDAGVPRWLSPANRARSEAIGLLEDGTAEDGRYDRVLHTVAQPRPDPCAGRR